MTSPITKPDTGMAHTATPGPWSLDNNDVRDEAQAILSDVTGCIVAEAFALDRPGDCEANAKLIVRAVNCHDELLAVLRSCASILPRYRGAGEFPSHDEELDAVLENVQDAIARAEGRQP